MVARSPFAALLVLTASVSAFYGPLGSRVLPPSRLVVASASDDYLASTQKQTVDISQAAAAASKLVPEEYKRAGPEQWQHDPSVFKRNAATKRSADVAATKPSGPLLVFVPVFAALAGYLAFLVTK